MKTLILNHVEILELKIKIHEIKKSLALFNMFLESIRTPPGNQI